MEQALNIKTGESVKIIGRKECFLDGVYEVVRVNEGECVLKMQNMLLTIKGSHLHINKLDLDKKYVQLNGDILELKYTKSVMSKFKGLFKK